MKILSDYPVMPEDVYEMYRHIVDILDDYYSGKTYLSADEYEALRDLQKGLEKDGVGLGS
jgi:hypothetical protein